jgi:hypothetical protein
MGLTVSMPLAGWAAIIGGLLWVVKATVILFTGVQPPLIYAVAPIGFAIALVGLAQRLGPASAWARWAGWLALAAGLAAVVQVVAELFTPSLLPTADETTVLTPVIVLAGFGSLLALALIGLAVRRAGLFPPPWSWLPLTMALIFPLLLALVVAMSQLAALSPALEERLIELPVLTLGLGWILLGQCVLGLKSN